MAPVNPFSILWILSSMEESIVRHENKSGMDEIITKQRKTQPNAIKRVLS
jgi:hypothetical protein